MILSWENVNTSEGKWRWTKASKEERRRVKVSEGERGLLFHINFLWFCGENVQRASAGNVGEQGQAKETEGEWRQLKVRDQKKIQQKDWTWLHTCFLSRVPKPYPTKDPLMSVS